METKDFIIYNGIAKAARRVFDSLQYIDNGTYCVQDLAKLENTRRLYYPENFDELEKVTVSFDGFSCAFPLGSVFNILKDVETAWKIDAGKRIKFIRKAETAPVCVSFAVPQLAKFISKSAQTKENILTPAVNFVCIDTKHRAIVAGHGTLLQAAAVPDMFVSEDAKEKYLISPQLLKTGKGTLTIDANGNATNGALTLPVNDENRFPSWENVLPAVADSQKINLNGVFAAFKKAVQDASKAANDQDEKPVQISGTFLGEKLQITGFQTFGKNTRTISVSLPQPCPFDFSATISGKKFIDAISAADSMFIYKNKLTSNVSVCFAAPGVCSRFNTLYYNFEDVPQDNTENVPAVAADSVPAPVSLIDVCTFPETNAANTPAALASVPQDEETPAVETRPSWENSLPAAAVSFESEETPQDETPAADSVPVSEDEENAPAFEDEETLINPFPCYEYIEKLQTYCKVYYQDETPETRAAYNWLFAHGVKIIFGEIYWNDICKGSVTKEIKDGLCTGVLFSWNVAKDEETNAPAVPAADSVQDEETPAADSVPVSVSVFAAAPAACPVDEDTLTNMQSVCRHAFEFEDAGFYPYAKEKLFESKIYFHFQKSGVLLFATNVENFAHAVPVQDENGKTKDIIITFAAPADSVPVSEDAKETPQDETPAVFAKIDNYTVQDENGNAVNFETYAPQLGTDEETPAVSVAADIDRLPGETLKDYIKRYNETANAAPQDEETPAVAAADSVSLPAPVCAADNLHFAFENGFITEKEYICTVWNVCVYDENGNDICKPAAPADFKNNFVPVQDEETPAPADSVQDEENAPETANAPAADSLPAVDEETPQPAPFASVFAILPEIPLPADSVQDETPAAFDEETNTHQDEETETPAVCRLHPESWERPRRARRARFNLRPWMKRAAAALLLIVCAVVASWERETPAVANVPAAVFAAADSLSLPVQDETPAVAADSVSFAPETPAVAAADSLPAVAKERPRNARKRARRAAADSLSLPAVADSVSLPADSVSFAAAADSVPAVADSLSFAVAAADSVSFAADSINARAAADSLSLPVPAVAADSVSLPVQDETPAVDEETPQDETETPAVAADSVQDEETPAADSVPVQDEETPANAGNAANGNAPAVPVVASFAAPAAPAPFAYVISCNIIHC